MRIVKPDHRASRHEVPDAGEAPSGLLGEEWDAEAEGDLIRVACPDCEQPIALPEESAALPVHALCPTRWDPFGLTVCPGSGRSVAGGAGQAPAPAAPRDAETAVRRSLPEGLDWRLQPFSDPGTATARPALLPRVRQAA